MFSTTALRLTHSPVSTSRFSEQSASERHKKKETPYTKALKEAIFSKRSGKDFKSKPVTLRKRVSKRSSPPTSTFINLLFHDLKAKTEEEKLAEELRGLHLDDQQDKLLQYAMDHLTIAAKTNKYKNNPPARPIHHYNIR